MWRHQATVFGKECKDPEIQGDKNYLSGKEFKKQSCSAPDNPALTVPSPSPRHSLDPPPLCVHSPRFPTPLVSQDPTQAGMLLSPPWGHPRSSRGPQEQGMELRGGKAALPPWPKGEQSGKGIPLPVGFLPLQELKAEVWWCHPIPGTKIII